MKTPRQKKRRRNKNPSGSCARPPKKRCELRRENRSCAATHSVWGGSVELQKRPPGNSQPIHGRTLTRRCNVTANSAHPTDGTTVGESVRSPRSMTATAKSKTKFSSKNLNALYKAPLAKTPEIAGRLELRTHQRKLHARMAN